MYRRVDSRNPELACSRWSASVGTTGAPKSSAQLPLLHSSGSSGGSGHHAESRRLRRAKQGQACDSEFLEPVMTAHRPAWSLPWPQATRPPVPRPERGTSTADTPERALGVPGPPPARGPAGRRGRARVATTTSRVGVATAGWSFRHPCRRPPAGHLLMPMDGVGGGGRVTGRGRADGRGGGPC
jgi:hypothetical protein